MNTAKVQRKVAQIRKKYNLTGRMTKKAFERICKGEGINRVRHSAYENLFNKCSELNGVTFNVKTGYRRRPVILLACDYRKRFNPFVAGHELGHALLRHAGDWRLFLNDFDAYENSAEEREANLFGSLMIGGKHE